MKHTLRLTELQMCQHDYGATRINAATILWNYKEGAEKIKNDEKWRTDVKLVGRIIKLFSYKCKLGVSEFEKIVLFIDKWHTENFERNPSLPATHSLSSDKSPLGQSPTGQSPYAPTTNQKNIRADLS